MDEYYVNSLGETYEDFVRDCLDNNEVPWSKDRWISYWRDIDEYEQEQIDRMLLTDFEKYGEED